MNSFMESTESSFLYEGSFDFLKSEDNQQLNMTQFPHDANLTNYAQCGAGPNNLGRYVSMILFTVVCIIGLFGNTLVIYVVLR